MARTLTKQQSIRKQFLINVISAVSTPSDEILTTDTIWKEKPVNIITFCRDYVGEPLFDGEQTNFCVAMTGKISIEFSTQYKEGHAFWGKGSGKDRSIAKLQAYLCYKLKLLYNPQKYLREKCGCSIGDGDNLDVANMSINARQAQNVFFKKFKSIIKRTINPKTGNNWFAEQGVDLREGYDIQNTEVKFSDSISAHSLNSETNTGEGLNLFFATIDEYGIFPPSQGEALADALRDSIESRFKRVGKLAIMSYHYYPNDPMQILYERDKDDTDVYSSKASTYIVNPLITKKDLAKKYLKNPEKAKMTYDCESKNVSGGYVTKKYMLDKMFSGEYENPIIGDLESVDANKLNILRFKDWFKGKEEQIYSVHVDLASGRKEDETGKVKKKSPDCAGFALSHPEKMNPVFDSKLRKELAKDGYILEMVDESVSRKGVVVDLYMQLVAKLGKEIQISEVRKFIVDVLINKMKFNIMFVTYDGWNSKESIQLLNEQGINANRLSMDINNEPYDTWKELMYQGLVKTYPSAADITHREAKELLIDSRGKINHPELSWDRLKVEGIENGSKDVMDAIAGTVTTSFDKIPAECGVYFG